jgi:hypothetical protein
MVKKRWLVVAAGGLVLLALYAFRTYPRQVAVTLQGVQYQVGSDKEIKPVILRVDGTRARPLFGPETFAGTVDISGASMPNRLNGRLLHVVFVSEWGGLLQASVWSRPQFYHYGALFPNQSFTEFTVTEWQHRGNESGWRGGNGLVISAPAKTRKQALRISNALMTAWSALLPGHPLK